MLENVEKNMWRGGCICSPRWSQWNRSGTGMVSGEWVGRLPVCLPYWVCPLVVTLGTVCPFNSPVLPGKVRRVWMSKIHCFDTVWQKGVYGITLLEVRRGLLYLRHHVKSLISTDVNQWQIPNIHIQLEPKTLHITLEYTKVYSTPLKAPPLNPLPLSHT